MSNYSITWTNQIADIPQQEWDALALPLKTPFLEWEWLHNLEASGSATARTGWLPQHLIVRRERQLIGAAPLYIKGHSQGEFVFDHQWADLAYRLNIEYYPKLLGMTPFTPAEGYRFLIAPGEDEELITMLMVNAINHFCQQHHISSCHFLYVDPQWHPIIQKCGFTTWLHHSYIWQNQGYQNFDDYLSSFNANQRRNIKREIKGIEKAGVTMMTLTGDEIHQSLLTRMYSFYEHTCDKFGWWGSKYLTKRFFEELHHRYRHRLLLAAAYSESNDKIPIGMSFCINKDDRLYGRYWGSFQEIEFLHFNACYYKPIEWAVNHNVQVFDPGAGGHHKKRRGFPATPNYSVHKFYPDRLEKIFLSYIDQINYAEERQIDAINQELPFTQTPLEIKISQE